MTYKEAVAQAAIALIVQERTSRINCIIEAHSIARCLGGRGYLTDWAPEQNELEEWAMTEKVFLDREHVEKL